MSTSTYFSSTISVTKVKSVRCTSSVANFSEMNLPLKKYYF